MRMSFRLLTFIQMLVPSFKKEILLLPDSLGVVSCTDHDLTNASPEASVQQATGAVHEDFAGLPRAMDPLVADDPGARPDAASGQSQAISLRVRLLRLRRMGGGKRQRRQQFTCCFYADRPAGTARPRLSGISSYAKWFSCAWCCT